MVQQFTLVETSSFPLHTFLWERVLLELSKQWEYDVEYETYTQTKLASAGLDVVLGPQERSKAIVFGG